MLNMKNLTKWWVALHDNGHIVPGFDNKFGSEMFFVVKGTELQTQIFYKVARTVQWKVSRELSPCEDRNGTEPRFFVRCTERLAEQELNCSVPWRKENNVTKKICDTPAEYEV